jgi:hypothetical protein
MAKTFNPQGREVEDLAGRSKSFTPGRPHTHDLAGVKVGHVLLLADGDTGYSVTARVWDPPVPLGGGGVEQVTRPLRRPLPTYRGTESPGMVLSILLDGWLAKPIHGPFMVSAPGSREDIDYRLDQFVLDPQGARKVDIADAVTDTSLTLTIEGASTLELTVSTQGARPAARRPADGVGVGHERRRARREALDQGRPRGRRPARRSVVPAGEGVEAVARHAGADVRGPARRDAARPPRRPEDVPRLRVTRAEFVAALARAAGLTQDEIYIPELHRKSSRSRSPTKVGVTERRHKGHKGITKHLHGITVKGVKATPKQIDILQRAMDVADKLNAPKLAVLAMYCAAIAESTVSFVGRTRRATAGRGSRTRAAIFKARRRAEAWHFLKGGKGFQGGGAIHQARRSTSRRARSPTRSRRRRRRGFYGQYRTRREKIYGAFYAGTQLIGGSTDVEITAEKPYAFARGKNENSWDAIQRLAQEVNFRAFIRKGVFWYASEEFLFNQAPQLDVVEGEDGRRRGHVRHRRRRPNLVNELQVTASARGGRCCRGWSRWSTSRAADGRWLVHQAERPLHDPQVTVTLNKSIPIKPEPAPETETPPPPDHGDPSATPVAYEATVTAVGSGTVSIVVPGYSEQHDFDGARYLAPAGVPSVGDKVVAVFTDGRVPLVLVPGAGGP